VIFLFLTKVITGTHNSSLNSYSKNTTINYLKRTTQPSVSLGRDGGERKLKAESKLLTV